MTRAEAREIERSVLLTSEHGRGMHDERPVEGCRACELVSSGSPLVCDDCKRPVRTVGTCAECLFARFEK